MTRIELVTPSLPRKCSTPELHWLAMERKTGIEPATYSLKAVALPDELLPHFVTNTKKDFSSLKSS